MVMRVASFFPFHTTYCLNGHSFIENELNRRGICFRKNDNAFLAVADPQALKTCRWIRAHVWAYPASPRTVLSILLAM
jgi:hypothetical protein